MASPSRWGTCCPPSEEFLSYLLVSETLVTEGGQKWEKWDQTITRLLSGVQNDDGSCTGHPIAYSVGAEHHALPSSLSSSVCKLPATAIATPASKVMKRLASV